MLKILLIIFGFLLFITASTPVSANDIFTNDKLISVDLGSQRLMAWENGKVVYETKISSGMNLTPTAKGKFRIYYKTPLTDMRGPSPYKNIYPTGKYLTKNVPNTMYFYQGYAIHGAYWHNNFGRPASHGCVNTPLAAAQWLYDFAPVGTQVVVW